MSLRIDSPPSLLLPGNALPRDSLGSAYGAELSDVEDVGHHRDRVPDQVNQRVKARASCINSTHW